MRNKKIHYHIDQYLSPANKCSQLYYSDNIKKTVTPKCFGPYWPNIRKYNKLHITVATVGKANLPLQEYERKVVQSKYKFSSYRFIQFIIIPDDDPIRRETCRS